jgi:hypothetical protein
MADVDLVRINLGLIRDKTAVTSAVDLHGSPPDTRVPIIWAGVVHHQTIGRSARGQNLPFELQFGMGDVGPRPYAGTHDIRPVDRVIWRTLDR